ncbi:PTS system ascorbate-specific transporter subunit IIC [Actinobacillus pleuropneumoniae]|nr:PTS system ascorbate-specific transporter subunit IIC [Actinobacillus pleuropneumoniae]KIE88939.1 PTS system ascorbate-specific transporter subunit IIC [Actinobacillus pleuropneumoniae]KIE95688.1 hypothetical protein AP780_02204 [Actinobacillus pleuropneumoniae]
MDSILFFILDILKVPSVLVGLIAFAGLVAQKKAFPDIIKVRLKPFSASWYSAAAQPCCSVL